MEEYPPNAKKLKEEPVVPEKKIEKVIEGKVIQRKKPLGKKFSELLIGGDSKSVGSYIFYDVLLPAMKDTIADVMTQGVERMLFGEARSTSRRPGSRRGGSSNYTNYSNYTRNKPPWDDRRQISPRARASHDFNEIILETRAEAEEVLDRLFDLVAKYETATVRDLYELVGAPSKFTDDKWGWADLRGAGITRVRNGYLLDMPRPEPLD
jgi:hypothetical protein